MISQAKFSSEYLGLNSVAKKVYEATPMAEPWTIQQIYGEIVRLGISLEHRAVHGALGAMAEKGLLREKPKGSFQREAIKPPAPKPEPTTMEIAMTKIAPAATITTTPLERFEALAARVGRLAQEVSDLSEAINDAVIDLQDEQEKGSDEMQKLRQLKALLQGL